MKQLPGARQSFSVIKQLYCSLGSPFDYLFNVTSELPFDIRSALIKCAQAQFFPSPRYGPPDTTLERIIKPLLSYAHIDNRGVEHVALLHLLQEFSGRPFACGLLLDLARSLPLPQNDIDSARMKSWGKEISACEGVANPNVIDFRPIFDANFVQNSLCPGVLAPNPTINHYIHRQLINWRHRMTRRIHYPRASNKTMSAHTADSYNQLFDDKKTTITQEEYLRIEADFGISLDGKCEMRQRWYPSGFKPRTYYAQGGTAYQNSYMLQQFFTDLVNCMPSTHHISRLRPGRLWLKEGQWFRVYDLSSFTSMMWEQKSFCKSLALFCRGHSFTYVDCREGVITVDMGELLDSYNETCNILPEVSYHRFDFAFWDHPSVQHVASMLGIYGNLMSCTFAHGVVTMQLAADEDQVNVAGDDGLAPENIESMDTTDAAIGLVGMYEVEKTFFSNEPGCIALKRPLNQTGMTVDLRHMVIWPNCAMLEYWLTNQVPDARYEPVFFPELDVDTRISSIGGTLLRTLRSYSTLGDLITNRDDVIIMFAFVHKLEELVEGRFDCKLNGGCLTQCGDRWFWPSIPMTYDEMFQDPLTRTVRNRYRNSAMVPIRDVQIVPKRWFECGDSFSGNMDQRLSLLVKLGYVEKEIPMKWVTGIEGYDDLLSSVLHQVPIVYHFVVAMEIPLHLQYL